MRLYEIRWSDGDKSWIAARTKKQAQRVYAEQRGDIHVEVVQGVKMNLVPENKYQTLPQVATDDGNVPMAAYVAKLTEPRIIAETF